ncbi:MAG: hypothetical protein JNK58_11655 [Phycisphaerae bacterium]|nr:hypothetical protein [Phycisphaerae bacterium]
MRRRLTSRERSRGSARAAAVVALLVLATSAAGLETILGQLRLQLRKLPIEAPSGLKFQSIPKDPPGWETMRDEVMSAEGMEELGTQNYVTRWYRRVDETGRPVDPPEVLQVHAAYYTGMIDTVPHVPERCMIGGGLEYAGASRVVHVPLDTSRLALDPDDRPAEGQPRLLTGRNNRVPFRVRLPRGVEGLEMMVTPFKDSDGRQTLWAGYFFIANGGVVASANDVRLLAFKLKDDYAYYAKVQFMSGSVASAEELGVLAAKFLDEVFPDLMQCVPDWTDVEEGRWPKDNPRGAKAKAGV